MSEQLKLRRIYGDVWLATWQLEEPVWAVVSGRSTTTAMMLAVIEHAQTIPWRTGTPGRAQVEAAVKELEA